MTQETNRGATRQARLQALEDLPVLLDEADVLSVLHIGKRKLDALIREGRLENCTMAGPRRLFRKLEVMALLAV